MEAMRLYAPAPSLMRITRRPIKLGEVELASGATVVIPIYVVHRHRRLWSDPLRFDPSRFAPEARAGRHRCAYMPFSTGSRSCIGGAFSRLETKAMLATFLAKARFELPEGAASAHHAPAQAGAKAQGDDAALALWQEIASRRPTFSPDLPLVWGDAHDRRRSVGGDCRRGLRCHQGGRAPRGGRFPHPAFCQGSRHRYRPCAAMQRLAAAIAGALLLPSPRGRSFATMRCNE